jgi:hypothetical protein
VLRIVLAAAPAQQSATTPAPLATAAAQPTAAPLTTAAAAPQPTAAPLTTATAAPPTPAPLQTAAPPTPAPLQTAAPPTPAPLTPAARPAAPLARAGFRTTADGPGFVQPPVAGFPAYGGGQLTAYQLISQYLLSQPVEGSPWPPSAPPPTSAYQDVRGQYTNQELLGEWLGFRQAVAGLRGQPPPGVAAADFETVRQQLQTELAYVQFANTWFGNLRTFLTELFDEDQMSVDLVADYLTLPVDSTADVVLNVLELLAAFVAGFLDVVAAIATEGTALAANAAIGEAIAGLVSTALSAAVAGIGSGAGVQLQVAQVQGELLQTRERALKGNDLTQAVYLSHWPLLQALGQPIAALQVTWPLGQADAWAAGGRRGYERYLWQTLAPVIWGVTYSTHLGGGYPSGYPSEYGIDWGIEPDCGTGDTGYVWVYVGHYDDGPDPAALSRLFDQPAKGDFSGPLGVSKHAVLFGYDGWNLPGALLGTSLGTCGPPLPQPLPPDPIEFRRPHRNPLPVRR